MTNEKQNSKFSFKKWLPAITGVVICTPLISAFLFWMIELIFLKNEISYFKIWSMRPKEILMVSFAFMCLMFYFFTQFFLVSKPAKNEVLASQRWTTEEEQREFFGVAPIDTSKQIPVGGPPINYLNENEVAYEKEAVHSLCVGTTRSGKSRKIVRQLVMLASMANESMIFNDPKKEMYYDFHNYLESKGYEVYQLDFRNLEYSQCYNPLDTVVECFKNKEDPDTDNADQYAQDIVTSIVADNGKGEQIWVDGQKALIKGLILANAQANIAPEKKNFYSVYQTLALLGGEKVYAGSQKPKMQLSVFMDSLPETNIARTAYTAITNSPEKTRGSFMTSALATLQIFSSQKLMKALSSSNFMFKDFTKGKRALFVVNPDEKATYNRVASIIFDQAYQSLVFEANKMSGRKLEKAVHMIYDEFGNMPAIPMIQSKMTVALSRQIKFHLYVQDFGQLDDVYGNEVAKIVRGNCNLWYFISSADLQTCKEIAEAIGEETIWTDSVSGNYNSDATTTGGGVSYQMQKRQLMDANELSTADNRDGRGVIVRRTYFKPSKVYLPDCSQYKWFSEMKTDENETIKEQNKLRFAVPRELVLNDDVIALVNGLKKEKDKYSSWTEVLDTLNKLRNSNSVNAVDQIIWYWAMRSDIEESVMNNILQFIFYSDKKIDRKDIIEYMNGDEFYQFLDRIDVDDEEIKEQNGAQDIEKISKAIDEKISTSQPSGETSSVQNTEEHFEKNIENKEKDYRKEMIQNTMVEVFTEEHLKKIIELAAKKKEINKTN